MSKTQLQQRGVFPLRLDSDRFGLTVDRIFNNKLKRFNESERNQVSSILFCLNIFLSVFLPRIEKKGSAGKLHDRSFTPSSMNLS